MRFATLRDFRTKGSALLAQARADDTIVVTLRGRPVALFVPVEEDRIEEIMQAVDGARLRAAVENIRAQAEKTGASKLSMADINRELRAWRRSRRA